jgi:hypothetical protein
LVESEDPEPYVDTLQHAVIHYLDGGAVREAMRRWREPRATLVAEVGLQGLLATESKAWESGSQRP